MTRGEPVLSLTSLVKSFGPTFALRELTLAVPPGAVGLLGPNGAGKTTLIKVLLGLLQPDSGEVRIAGLDPRKKVERMSIRRGVGYMPEGDCLLPRMSAVDLVSTLGRITGLSPEDAMTRAHETLDYVGLEEARYRELTEYSTGMKQRLKLAQALVHDPQLLLLDEPTNGLDPKGRRHMLELIRDLGHEQGKNVLLCSHLLPDVERTCDHVIVLDRGRSVAGGSLEELTGGEGQGVRVRVAEQDGEFRRALDRANKTFEVEKNGAYRVQIDEGADADEVFALAASAGTPVESVATLRSTLEDVFMEVLSRSAET